MLYLKWKNSQNVRVNAFNTLCELIEQQKGIKAKNKFAHWYQVLITYKSFRETPKFIIILCLYQLRKLYLNAGQIFTEEGRINDINDIFNFGFHDVQAGFDNPGLDLRKLMEHNTYSYKVINNLPMDHPKIIDSRGKIYKAPTPELKDNQIIGFPVSSGCIRARVKVLNAPDEKPLYPGEILVARATNPGWTPLFVNASAIILEVGGLLQHGSLVAREYGKPCVVGIEKATSLFKDGQLIEVDGNSGIITFIQDNSN